MREDGKVVAAPASRPQPAAKPEPPIKILPNLEGLRADAHLRDFLRRSRPGLAVVNFGASWCAHCHAVLPHFLALAGAAPPPAAGGPRFALAQVDGMAAAAAAITHTPTIAVYRDGRRVDQFFGASGQALRDHLWLHAD